MPGSTCDSAHSSVISESKLIRYFASLDILLNVLYDERKNLTGTFMIMLIVLTLAASALYVVDGMFSQRPLAPFLKPCGGPWRR